MKISSNKQHAYTRKNTENSTNTSAFLLCIIFIIILENILCVIREKNESNMFTIIKIISNECDSFAHI